MVITLDWSILQFALVVAVFLLGITMGWKYMAIGGLGIFLATLATDAIAPRIERLVNRFLSVGAAFGGDFTGAELTAPTVDIAAPDLPLWQMGFLILVALPLVLFVTRWLGNRIGVGLLGRFWGGVMGALAAVILLGKLTEYWQRWITAPGRSDPFANLNLRLDLPVLALGGSTTTINWAQLAGLAVVLLVALLIGYAFYRALRLIF